MDCAMTKETVFGRKMKETSQAVKKSPGQKEPRTMEAGLKTSTTIKATIRTPSSNTRAVSKKD